MSDPLYKKEILRLAADAHGAGKLDDPHRTGEAFNPACGDRVVFQVELNGEGRIHALAHETRACVLAQASAAILGRDAKAKSLAELEQLHADVSAMLKEQAPSPEGYAAFEGAVEHSARHRCVLLPIDALLKAVKG